MFKLINWEGFGVTQKYYFLEYNVSFVAEFAIYMDYLHLVRKTEYSKKLELASPIVHQMGSGFVCGVCGRTYKLKSSLRNHQKWECGKEPQFKCKLCDYKAKQKMHLLRHMQRLHRKNINANDVDKAIVDEEMTKCKNTAKKFNETNNISNHVYISKNDIIKKSST